MSILVCGVPIILVQLFKVCSLLTASTAPVDGRRKVREYFLWGQRGLVRTG